MNRGVSVAEKRAMLEAAGEPWPVCDCHGEPKKWTKDAGRKSGGFWCCREKKREAQRRYQQSEKGREAKRRYKQSEKGRAEQHRYRQSEKGREANRRYDRSEKRRETFRRRYHSVPGYAEHIRAKSRDWARLNK